MTFYSLFTLSFLSSSITSLNSVISSLQATNKFKLISVGRLSEEKGYDRLLKVFKQLDDEGFDLGLTIVGSGEKYNELTNYIEQNNLKDKVFLLGYRDNPYKYVKNSDLFVCSSISEGFSLVIGEAMAVGIPVISVECPGPNEVIGFGEYGMLVNNDESSLCNGIKMLIDDKKLYDTYRTKAIERGRMFSIGGFIEEVEDILNIN